MGSDAVIAHGGGPTAVLNASLAGLIESYRTRGRLFAALYGLSGLRSGDLCDLTAVGSEQVQAIARAPGSAIGSSRLAMDAGLLDRILDVLARRDIHTFFYTGGNGSMRTALELLRAAQVRGYDLQVIGIPKTIDNDLRVTHHTPGYASTARFFACAARDVGEDNRSLPSPICVLETLGRNAGWIVAATALARNDPDDAPHLIYFPERRLSLERIAADVKRVYRRLGRVVVAVCEGQLDETGQPFGAEVDRPEHPTQRLASNLGHTLALRLAGITGLRARSEKPGLLGRCCGDYALERDRKDAFACGQAAARAAAAGETGVMIALRRDSTTFATPLETVAGFERLLPDGFLSPEENDVTPDFLNYARDLIGAVPPWPRLSLDAG